MTADNGGHQAVRCPELWDATRTPFYVSTGTNVLMVGVAYIVNAGPADMGRNIDFPRQVSMKPGVPIVKPDPGRVFGYARAGYERLSIDLSLNLALS